jgi:hypothetical protein
VASLAVAAPPLLEQTAPTTDTSGFAVAARSPRTDLNETFRLSPNRLSNRDIESGESVMSAQRSGKTAGIGLGGILVIVGIVVAIVWSLLIGIIIALVGLIAFGGFVRGKWY